jgi:hypothetical protein
MKLRRRNHLFSKVVVLMPKVTLIIGKEEMGWTWIAAAANQLVGNYSAMEHNACAMQLRHGRLNRGRGCYLGRQSHFFKG